MPFNDGVDRATGYLITSPNWNDLLGASGSLMFLKTHAHDGATGGGGTSLGPLVLADYTTAAAPAAPGAAKGRYYVVTGDRPGFRSGAAGAAEQLESQANKNAASGYAGLDGSSLLTAGQVPDTHGVTPSAHHTRSHTVTGTSDHTAGNWKVLYTNGSGQVIELALGAANTVLQSAGATSAPTFATPTTAAHGASSHDDRTRTMWFSWMVNTAVNAGAGTLTTWGIGAAWNTSDIPTAGILQDRVSDGLDVCYAIIAMPSDMVAGTPSAIIMLTSNGAAGNYVLQLGATEMIDGTTLTTAAPGGTTTTGALTVAAAQFTVERETIAFPIATLAAADWCRVTLSRAPTNGSDTLAATVRTLIGALLSYTADM